MYRKLFEFIFFVILISIMVMSLNMAVADSTAMEIAPMQLLKYTFLIVLAAAIFVRFPITLLGAVVIAVGIGIYAYAKGLVIPADVISYFREFIEWLPQYIVGYDSFRLKFSYAFAIAYIVFVTLIITLIVFNKKGYAFLIALGTGAFAFFWFVYVAKARLYFFYYLFAALILYSYNVYNKRKQEWINADSKIDKYIELKWIFNSLIIVIISILISQVVVLNFKPVQWSWLNERALQIFPFIENWRNDNFDGYSFGFGARYGIDAAGYRTERLGGPVKLSERIMLIVESSATGNIYLRGTVKDFYSGNSWTKTKKTSAQYNSDSQVPLPFSGIDTFDTELKVTHQSLITSTIFAPNTLSKVEHKSGSYYVDLDDEAYFPRTIIKRDSYTVKSVAPYINIQLLRNLKPGSSASVYSQLPDNISQRVKKLAQDITSKYDNDYDKAKAIEGYLRENYRYTLTPSEVPEGSEFVDYFLFEGKEGYCTYFATSMAVLLRAVDIPCRYIEGFLVKYDGSYIRNVAGTDAHAWVEVNFGPYGWLSFEATPAYPLAGYREQGEVPEAPIPESSPNSPSDPSVTVETDSRDRNLAVEDDETSIVEEGTKEISIGTGIFLAVIAILVLRISYLLLKRAYIELRIDKAADRQYSVMYFKDLLIHLKKLNIKMSKEETMREFWHKVKYALEEDYGNGDEIIKLLEKSRYGSGTMNSDERKELEAYRKMMKKFVTTRLGTIKYFISYYIIGF